MYVDNGKISARQTFRLYVFDLMGIGTLLLPPFLAKLCGCDGIWAIIIGTGVGFGYLLYLGYVMKCMGTDLTTYLREQSVVWIKVLMFVWICFHALSTASFCVYVFTKLMMQSLIQEVEYGTVLAVLVLCSVYAVSGGLESRARVYEVAFYFVLIPYVAMMLASVKDFEPVYVQEFFVADERDFIKGVYLVFLLLTPLFYSLFLVGPKGRSYGKGMVRTVAGAVGLTALILLGSYLLLLGNFGSKSLETMEYPVVTLMSTIQFKGNFLKRMDALMVAVWFFTLFALLNLHMHYGTKILQELMPKGKHVWLQKALVAIGVYTLALCFYNSDKTVGIFLDYYSYIAVPIMVISPLVLLLVRRRRK